MISLALTRRFVAGATCALALGAAALPAVTQADTGQGPANFTIAARTVARFSPNPGRNVAAHLARGTTVRIACQSGGALVYRGGQGSAVWDRLTDGTYVSDLFVLRDGSGNWADPDVIRQCTVHKW
jgi:hypothetical protein